MPWGEIIGWGIFGLVAINASRILTNVGRRQQWSTAKIIAVDVVFIVIMFVLGFFGYVYLEEAGIVSIEH